MEYGLPSAWADIEHCSISLLDVSLASNLGRSKMAAPDQFGVRRVGFFESCKMFLGNDEHVRGSLRTDVFESKDMVVLINLFCRDFAADDATEKAAGGGISHSLLSFYRMMRGVKGMECQRK